MKYARGDIVWSWANPFSGRIARPCIVLEAIAIEDYNGKPLHIYVILFGSCKVKRYMVTHTDGSMHGNMYDQFEDIEFMQ